METVMARPKNSSHSRRLPEVLASKGSCSQSAQPEHLLCRKLEGDFAGNLPLILASCFLPWGTAQKV